MGDEKGDFSPKRISKSVWKKILGSGLTIWPAVLSGLGWLAFGLLTTPIGLAVGIGGLTLSALYLIIQGFFRFPGLEAKHVKKLRKILEARTRQKRDHLGDSLEELGCNRGALQLQRLYKAFSGVEEIIDDKFSETELSYGRYHGMAEQAYLTGLDYLDRVANTLRSVSSININELKKDLRKQGLDEASKKSIEERIALKSNAQSDIEKTLGNIEAVITGLETVSLTLTTVQTRINRTDWSLEEAMEELADLSKFSQTLQPAKTEKELLTT